MFQVSTGIGVDSNWLFPGLRGGQFSVLAGNSSQYVIQYAADGLPGQGLIVVFSGSGLSYSGPYPATGTISEVDLYAGDGVTNLATASGGSAFASYFATPQFAPAILPGAEYILGNAGNDVLHAYDPSGINVLAGGAGRDILVGGPGEQLMYGGAGVDKFEFVTASDSHVGAYRDEIYDFSHAQHDKIDLHLIDANARANKPGNQAFHFIGAQSFKQYDRTHPHAAGLLRAGTNGIVQADVNGDGHSDFDIGTNVRHLTAHDFIL